MNNLFKLVFKSFIAEILNAFRIFNYFENDVIFREVNFVDITFVGFA